MSIKSIFDLSSNDNHMISFTYDEEDEEQEANAVIETWDNKIYRVIFYGLEKMEMNGSIGFEIGNIAVKPVAELDSEWERDFKNENAAYDSYTELIIYDPWEDGRINFRAVFEHLAVSEITDNRKNKAMP